ncbi:unnamed protein product, partial [Mesorhabditis belari]|uniref:Uncharacterized protein n=1 Tax=Mesorhabditis belari TaxID=2138241 RepID=A0AAF3F1M0_9BILA
MREFLLLPKSLLYTVHCAILCTPPIQTLQIVPSFLNVVTICVKIALSPKELPENSNLFTRLHLFSNKEKFTVWCKSCRNDTMGNSGEPMAQLATEVIDYLVRSRKMIRNSIHPLHFEELCPQIERNPMDPFSKYCSISCVERVKGQKVAQMVAINSPKAPKFIKRAAKRQ